jgi:phage-related minor tail protein
MRRRVVFELTVEQLPLLEAAQARHGSKRAALLAALEAEARVEELERAARQGERAAAKHERNAKREDGAQAKQLAKLQAALKTAERKAADAERRLDQAITSANEQAAGHQASSAELRDTVAERDERIDELEEVAERAFDSLFCARCEKWAPPSQWAWGKTRQGGHYAYHQPCSDHGPGLLGAASWLGHQRH